MTHVFHTQEDREDIPNSNKQDAKTPKNYSNQNEYIKFLSQKPSLEKDLTYLTKLLNEILTLKKLLNQKL